MPDDAGNFVNGTAYAESWNDRLSTEFLNRNWHLLLVLIGELLMVVGIYAYHMVWRRTSKRREKDSSVLRLCEEYSLELLRHFLPSAKVEKYRFRGMRPKTATASIAFEGIGLELHNGQRVLEGVTGEFHTGRMCAIMGPSGAGKTSLMNVLCDKAAYGKTSGRVLFNGQEGNFQEYRTVMGFVPQEDVVHEGLTVGEQIRFSSELRNPRGTPAVRRKAITEDVLNVMQLGHIQNSIVGGLEQRGISGGQRKRVSIGLELAADPTVLFLDEPTSGLDASSSLAIVHSLKRMSQLGMTSIMVVHQPRYSLFTLFDDVLLLGRGGRTVYLGPAVHAKAYFERLGFVMPESENPADWLLDIISGDVPNARVPHFKPEMLVDLWEEHKDFIEVGARKRSRAQMDQEDWETLVHNLDREWPRISYQDAPSALDAHREGVLRERELLRLLAPGESGEPDQASTQAVRELFRRIAGSSQMTATREEVLDFLADLHGIVASDRVQKQKPRTRAGRGGASSASSRLSSRSSSRSICGEPEVAPVKMGPDGRSSSKEMLSAGPEPVADGAPQVPPSECGVDLKAQLDHQLSGSASPSSARGYAERASPRQGGANEEAAPPQEYSIILDKDQGGGASLGAIVSVRDGTTLLIESVIGGLVKDWNAANPSLKVNKGDRIMEVNGIQGSAPELLEECERSRVLHLRLQRHERRKRRRHRRSRGSGSSRASSCGSSECSDCSNQDPAEAGDQDGQQAIAVLGKRPPNWVRPEQRAERGFWRAEHGLSAGPAHLVDLEGYDGWADVRTLNEVASFVRRMVPHAIGFAVNPAFEDAESPKRAAVAVISCEEQESADDSCWHLYRFCKRPKPDAVSFTDPRAPQQQSVGVIGFYYPDREEACDKLCDAGFLGNFYDLGSDGIALEAPCDAGTIKSFKNAEAAFQALKFWSQAGDFAHMSGSAAFQKKQQLTGKEDFTFGGFGSSWKGMWAVLKAKFKDQTPWAAALLETGDAFLLEHNSSAGRDKVWSDNCDGEGTNWLGLQLMLLRDQLSGRPSWTPYIESLIDPATGRPQDSDSERAFLWQATVRAARQSLVDILSPPQLDDQRQTLKVTIVGARGLRSADWVPGTSKSDPYCVCEIPGKPRSKVQTKVIDSMLDPVWNHHTKIADFAAGDALEFTVWDKDFVGQGDLLGRAVLADAKFLPDGFDGELKLHDGAEGTDAYLTVRVRAVRNASHDEYSVVLDKTDGMPLGAVVSHLDSGTLRVDSVTGGLVKNWNTANPELQVTSGDHIVEVNGLRGKVLELLEECEKTQVLNLRLRRGKNSRRRTSSNSSQNSSGPESNAAGVSKEPEEQDSQVVPALLGRVAPDAQSPQGKADGAADAKRHSSRQKKSRRSSSRSSDKGSGRTSRNDAQVAGEQDGPEVGASRPGEESLEVLSPRTRAVWHKTLSALFETKEEVCEEVAVEVRDSVEVAGKTTTLRVVLEGHSEGRPLPNLPMGKSYKSIASVTKLSRLARSQKLPPYWKQLGLLIHRSFIQWWRGNRQRGIFLGVIGGASVILAVLDTFVTKEHEWEVNPYLNLHSGLALLTSVFSLGVFSTDRPVFWRERASGISVLAFYLAKCMVNLLDLMLQCFLLAAVYYVVRQPFLPFGYYFQPFILVAFAASGMGYFISSISPPRHAPFIVAIIIFISCGLLGHPLRVETMADSGVLEVVMDLMSITRWSVSLLFITYLDTTHRADAVPPEERAELEYIEQIYRSKTSRGEIFGGFRAEVVFLIGIGLTWHVAAYFGLRLSHPSSGGALRCWPAHIASWPRLAVQGTRRAWRSRPRILLMSRSQAELVLREAKRGEESGRGELEL